MRRVRRNGDALDRRTALVGGLALAATTDAAFAASAFPSRPLVIMAPANPGGGWDQLARLMQLVIREQKLSPRPMEVLNRGGAGGAIGLAELVSRRHGDPYMIMASGAVMIGSTIAQDSPFRVSDAEPLARLLTEHLVIAVPAASPFRTIGAFMDAYRADPATVSWCGGSAGGVDHILVGQITEAAGVPSDKLRYVAYSGSGEATAAILGGQITAGVAGYSEWRGLADTGRIRFLATASPERFGARDIPTLKESGFSVVLENWRGVLAPPGLAPEHIAWWMSVLERMHASRAWQDHLRRNNWEDGWLVREDFGRFIRSEEALNTRTLARLGIGGTAGGYAPMGPWAFPAIIGAAGAATVAGVVVEQIRARPGEAAAPAGLEDDDHGGGPLPIWKRFGAGVALASAYAAALALAGFLIATPIFILGLCVLMRSKTLRWDVLTAAGLTAGVWLLFTRLLHVNLP